MAMANAQNVNKFLQFLSMIENSQENPSIMTPSFKFRMEILMACLLDHWSKTSTTIRAAKLVGADTGQAMVEAAFDHGLDVTVFLDFFMKLASGDGGDLEGVFKTQKIRESFVLKAKEAAIATSRNVLG